eukprot:TRINITY_DN14752_c1_g1_i1.p1 TRINITY_DN14752_c1_g1~~TRINITY_DN14752_c1_g1_i1.p1  ORF type:complete len:230 (+),score=43.70 TRINITY_DN14752_c1_g1_i1:54-743(+)
MASNLSMSFRSGENFLHLRLPVSNEFAPFLIDACAAFHQGLTQDDVDLARRLEEGMDRLAKFRERAVMDSFHDVRGPMGMVPEGDEDESESEESRPLKREMALKPQDIETIKKMDLKVEPLSDDGSGSGSQHQRQEPQPPTEVDLDKLSMMPMDFSSIVPDPHVPNPQSPPELDLDELSMKPMDFTGIAPDKPHSTSNMKKASCAILSRMRRVRLPNLRAWHVAPLQED